MYDTFVGDSTVLDGRPALPPVCGIIGAMSVFLVKRLATFLATLAIASALVFAVLELLPGNVAQVILGDSATPQAIAALEAKLGLDQPALARYST